MMTPEEEAAFLKESEEEISQMDIDAVTNSAEVQKLLAVPEIAECGVYKFGDVEIRYRPFLTRHLRAILQSGQKRIQMKPEEALKIQEEVVYTALAEMCKDAPFNNPNAWKLIDIKCRDGRVFQIFQDMIKLVGGNDKTLKDFRGKS